MKSNPSLPDSRNSDSFTVISGLAHELDSPLKSILDKTRKLINEYKSRNFEYVSFKDFKNIIATLEQLERQLEHCSQTTSRMLYVGKRQARLEADNCQVNDIIRKVVAQFSQQLKAADVKVISKLDDQLPLSAVGQIECHQIIHNVIINALQAMPSGGVIKVKTSIDKTHKAIGIDITDQGVGITPDHLPKIFEPFFTTKERGVEKSSGLGLSIIYSIINSVGGSINIKSSLRKGTTVQIWLPVLKAN